MDPLDDLPVKNEAPSSKEMQLLSQYFGTPKKASKWWAELKNVAIATVLFLLLSNSYFDKLLEYIPYTESIYARLALKGLIFAVLFYVALIMLG